MRLHKELRARVIRETGRDPYRAWASQKSRAAGRGVGFTMSFLDWWALWGPEFANRGARAGQFVMCRTKDEGKYEVGNVRVDTVRANHKERLDVLRGKAIKAAWTFDGEDRSSCADWLENRRSGSYLE